jgi:hypothetical protein
MEVPQGNSLYSYLKHTKMSFFPFTNQRTERTCPAWVGGLLPVGWERKWGNGKGG